MSFHIDMPPALSGGVEEQLRMLHRYLYRMAEQLNSALVELDAAQQAAAEASASAGEKQQELQTQFLLHNANLRREIKQLKEKLSDE